MGMSWSSAGPDDTYLSGRIELRATREQELQEKLKALIAEHDRNWAGMIDQWRAAREGHSVWLMYSANYLFNTDGLKWAVDPILLHCRVSEAPVPDVQSDLAELSFVILTHAHMDHCDVELWQQLKGCKCHWIVPQKMVDFFLQTAQMDGVEYSVAVAGQQLCFDGIRITPFVSPHYEVLPSGELNNVDAAGYAVEVGGRRYLFPGDIRTYDAACYGSIAETWTVFAHIFLGRCRAMDPNPPLLDEFVRFYLGCNPRKIILSHLYEIARGPEDCWCLSHAQTVKKALLAVDGDLDVIIPQWYEKVML